MKGMNEITSNLEFFPSNSLLSLPLNSIVLFPSILSPPLCSIPQNSQETLENSSIRSLSSNNLVSKPVWANSDCGESKQMAEGTCMKNMEMQLQ